MTNCTVCCSVASFAWTADWTINQVASGKSSVILIRRVVLCGWIVSSLCMWCKVQTQEPAVQTVCAMQMRVAKWKCLHKKWHASGPHMEMLTSQATNGNEKRPLCMTARVWVCMPLHAPSVSVFVCCLATSDACANEGKFSCFIWSWKILVGYVVVASEQEVGGLAAVGYRVVCWCQQALQQPTPWLYLPLLQHVSRGSIPQSSSSHITQSIWNPRPCKHTELYKVQLCACENQKHTLRFVFYGCHDTDMSQPTSASGVRCSVRLNLTAGIH